VDQVLSTDFLHDSHSSIFDSGSSIELNSRFLSWAVGMTTSGLLQSLRGSAETYHPELNRIAKRLTELLGAPVQFSPESTLEKN
jgi:hypothetical protein